MRRTSACFFFNDTATTEIYTLSLHDALPIFQVRGLRELFLDDLVAEVDALVADVDPGASDELLDLLLALAAERALEQVTALTDSCHLLTSTSESLVLMSGACALILAAPPLLCLDVCRAVSGTAGRAIGRFPDRAGRHRRLRAMTHR